MDQLHYQFTGNPESDKLIIFLHEGLGSVSQWKQFPERLCEACNACGLVYDRAGYGKSPGSLLNRKTSYLHEAADELHDVIQQLISPHYTVYLYGHSDGGSIALIYAARHSDRIKGIITEAAHVFVEPETIQGVKAAIAPFQKGKFDGLKKYHGDRYKEVFMAWNSIWLHPDFIFWDITANLHHITCPQLIIQGKDDQYGTLKQVDTIAAKTTGKSSIFIVENCGHAPHRESEKETLIQTKVFLNGST